MTGRKLFFWMVVVLSMSLMLSCSTLDNNTVAKIGNEVITVDDFKSEVLKKYRTQEKAATATVEELEEILDKMVVKRLQTIDAYNKGFDTTPEIKEAYEKELNKGAIFQLYIKEIRDKIITEDMIREFYDNDKEEIQASHILVKTADENDADARKKIDKIYNEATAPGANFAELAQKYTDDKSASDGDLGWFRYGRMVDPFWNAANALKVGEISKPVLTEYGWHIIQLNGRRAHNDKSTFEEAKESIANKLTQQNAQKIEAAADEYIESLKVKNSVVYFEDNIALLKDDMEKGKGVHDLFEKLSQKKQNLTLATLHDGKTVITTTSIKETITKVARSGRDIDWDDIGKKLIDEHLMMEYLLPDAARELGLLDHKDVIEKAIKTRDRKVLYEAQKEIIHKKSEPTEEQTLAYYSKHPDKFQSDAQYTLLEILVSEKDQALELLERAKNGENMRDMALKYSERTNVKETKGILGPFKKTQYGVIGKEAAKAEIGEIKGPILHGKKYSVFKLISKEDPKPLPYEDEKVKRKVQTQVRQELRETLEAEWVAKLKSSMSYKINTKPLANLFPKS